MTVNGPALASVVAGSVFLYAGIKGKSISQAVQFVIQGKNPSQSPQTNAIADVSITDTASSSTSGGGGGGSSSVANANATGVNALKNAAKSRGWDTGAQWQALNALEMSEAGYSATVKNPTSGALGMAQALGHGNGQATAGKLGNEYGGYGLTDAQARLANSGNAAWQAVWMCNYIATSGNFHDPISAWAFHRAHNWY
jgi:hypothetical protein